MNWNSSRLTVRSPTLPLGTITWRSTWSREAPSMMAASSSSLGISAKNWESTKMTKGLAYQGRIRAQ